MRLLFIAWCLVLGLALYSIAANLMEARQQHIHIMTGE